jgi:hypothetical protein
MDMQSKVIPDDVGVQFNDHRRLASAERQKTERGFLLLLNV